MDPQNGCLSAAVLLCGLRHGRWTACIPAAALRGRVAGFAFEAGDHSYA